MAAMLECLEYALYVFVPRERQGDIFWRIIDRMIASHYLQCTVRVNGGIVSLEWSKDNHVRLRRRGVSLLCDCRY